MGRLYLIIFCISCFSLQGLFANSPLEANKEWRFISLAASSITSFYNVNPHVDVLISYDNSQYKIAARTNSIAYTNYTTLDQIKEGNGYWVKLTRNTLLNSHSTSPINKTSYLPSWHMIAGSDQTVDSFLSQHGEVSQIFSFQNDRWLGVQRNQNQQFVKKEFTSLQSSQSYWIKSDFSFHISKQSSFSIPRKSHTSLLVKTAVFNIGGENSNIPTSSVERYSFHTRKWGDFSNLNQARFNHSSVAYQDTLYVYGGTSTNGVELSSLESFDLNTSTSWSNISNTTDTRSGHSSLISSDKLYVIGGFLSNQSTNALTNQINSYHLINNQWTKESVGGSPRIHHDSILIDGKIYIIGGTTKQFDVYDTVSKSWSQGTELSTFRIHHKLYHHKNYIYVVGGENENADLVSQIWRYSIVDKIWDYSFKDISKLSKASLIFEKGKLYLLGGERSDRVALSDFQVVSIDSTDYSSSNQQVLIENVQNSYNTGLLTMIFDSSDLENDLFYTSSLSYQINSSSTLGFSATSFVTPNLDVLGLRNQQTIVWDTKKEINADTEQVWLKLESLDQQGAAPNIYVTGPIAIYNGWPKLESIQTQNISSNIDISYEISDVDNDLLDIRFEYSIDDGFSWISSNNIVGVTNSLSIGTSHFLTWISYQDIQGDYEFVKIRLSVSDGKTKFINKLSSNRFSVFNGINDVPSVQQINLLGVQDTNTLLIRPKRNQNSNIIGSYYSLDEGSTWLESSYTHPSIVTTQTFNYLSIQALFKDIDKHQINVDFKFKGGSVSNYIPLTGILSPTNGLESEVVNTFIWLSSVDTSENMTDLQISVRADDLHFGSSVYTNSEQFKIYNANVKPILIVKDTQVVSNSSVASLTEKNGITSFVISINDSDSTTFDLDFEYSFDKLHYYPVNDEYVSGPSGKLSPNSNEIIHWLSSLNVKIPQDTIYLKFRVFDQRQYSNIVRLSLNLTRERFELNKKISDKLHSRAFHSSFEKDNLWYLIGGRDASGNTTSIQKIGFPDLDVSQEDFIYENSNFSSSIVGDKAFIYGGVSISTSTLNTAFNVLDFNAPPLNVETYLLDGSSRIDHCAITYNSKIYYYGGQSTSGLLNTLDVYNPLTGLSRVGSSPQVRYGHQCLVYDDKLWVFGGFTSQTGIVEATSEILIYDLIANTWRTRSSTLINRAFATAKLWKDKVILSGGIKKANTQVQNSLASLDYTSSGDVIGIVEEYNLLTQSTQSIAQTNLRRAFHQSLIKNDVLYTSGGLNEFSQVQDGFLELKLQDQNFGFTNSPSQLSSQFVTGDNSNLLIQLKIQDSDVGDKSYVNISYTTDNFASFNPIQRGDLYGNSTDLSSNTTYNIYWDSLSSLGKSDYTSVALKYVIKDSNLGEASVSYSNFFPVYNGVSTSPVVSNLLRLSARDEVLLSFDMIDVNNDTLRLKLDYSLDGQNYLPATLKSKRDLYSSNQSILLTWDSMSDITYTTQVHLKLKVDDKHIASFTESDLSSFNLLNGQSIPKISNIEVNGNRFDIEIRCHIFDNSSIASSLGLSLYYSTDNENFFLAKSIEGLEITSNDSNIKFTWNSLKDIVSDESVVYIQIVPRDETGVGRPEQSKVFQVNNNNWSEDFSLKNPRTSHSSIAYENRIYVWGGQDISGNLLNTLEMYDPVNGEWRLLKSGGSHRMNHSAVVYGNQIFFWGGENLNGRLNSTDVYNIDSNTWIIKSSGGALRTKHSAHLYNDKIYYFGGREFGSNRLNTIDIYDIKSDSFTSGLSGGTGRDAHVSALLEDKVFLFGGLSQRGFEDSLDIYELAPWRSSNTNISRAHHTSEVSTSGNIYIIGGVNSSNIVTNSIDMYKATSRDLELVSTYYLNSPRKNHASVLLEDAIYVFGGEDNSNTILNIERFDLRSNTSSILATTDLSLISNKAIALSTKVYLVGGLQNGQYSKNILEFSTSVASLTTIPLQLTQARKDFTLNKVESAVYVVGGFDGSNHLSLIEKISFNDMTITSSNLNTTISSHVSQYWNNNLYISGGVTNSLASTKVYVYSLKNNTWKTDLDSPNLHIGSSSIEYKNRMYVLGGFQDFTNMQTKTSIYSQWRSIDQMAIRRSDAQGVVIDKKWHIFGGYDSGLKNEQIIFDIDTEKFSYADQGGVSKQNMSADLIQDQVIFIGGTSASGINDKVEHYDIPKINIDPTVRFTGDLNFIDKNLASFTDASSSVLGDHCFVYGGSSNGLYSSSLVRINKNSLETISLASMPIRLSGQSATNDGKDVYLFGGVNTSGLSTSAFKYDVANNNYHSLTSLTVARKNHTSTFYNSKIYLHGGENSTGITSGIDIYNINNNFWTRRSTKTIPRSQHTANLYKGRIFFMGGKVSVGSSLVPTSSVHIYFVDGNRWIEGVKLPVALYDHSTLLQKDKLYVYGGYQTSGSLSNFVYIYDLIENNWLAPLTLNKMARARHSSFVSGSRIVSIGGMSTRTNDAIIETLDLDFIGGNYQASIDSSVHNRLGHNVVAYDDAIYIFGGNSLGSDKTDIYHQDLKIWTQEDSYPSKSVGAAIVRKDSVVYRWGGQGTSILDQIESWNLPVSGSLLSSEISGSDKKSKYSVNVVDDKIYFVGGLKAPGETSTTISIYDPMSLQWDVSRSVNLSKHSQCTFLRTNKDIIVFGGESALGVQTDTVKVISAIDSKITTIDTSNNISGFNALSIRSSAVCQQTSNVAYVIGGISKGATTSYLNSVYEINVDNLTISQLTANDYEFANASSTLHDSKIYIYGGERFGNPINEFRQFDTITKKWTTLPPGQIARSSHSSAVLSHYLFIFGGNTGLEVSNKIEVYDLVKKKWLGNSVNGIKRANFTAVTYKKDILLFGGESPVVPTSLFEKFSLKNKEIGDISGDFSKGNDVPVNLSEHSSVSLSDGSIILLGGFELNSSTLNPNTYRYDSKHKFWSTTNDTHSPILRRGHTSNQIDNQIYSWGGYLANGSVNNQMSIYDTSLKQWSEGLYGGTSRAQHTGNLSNGKLYFAGGNTNSANPNEITSFVDIFDLNTWSQKGSVSLSLSDHSMEIRSDQLYLWGGKNNEEAKNTLIAYDLLNKKEISATDGGTARVNHCSTSFDDKIFYWGGFAGSGPTNTMDVYDVLENRWIEGIPGGTARQGHDCSSDGKYMYVWGGSSNAVIQNTFNRYTLNPFDTSTLTVTPRIGATADIYDSVVYVYGGTSTAALDNMDTLQSVSNGFVLTANLYPSGNQKMHHASIVKNDKIYYFGGLDENGVYLPNMEIFDPVNKTWDSSKPSNVKGLAGAALVNSSNFILVVGGEFNASEINQSILRYDSVINQWETSNIIDSPILERSYHSAVLVTNIVYVYGGRITQATTTPFYTNTFQAFSIQDFTSIGPAQSGGKERAYHKSHFHNGSIYIYGGIDNSGKLVKTVDRYDIATNKWFLGVNVGDPRTFNGVSQKAATFATGEKFYYYSGSNESNQVLNTLSSYDPVRWKTLTSGPEPKIDVMGEYYNNRIYYWGGIDSSVHTNQNLNIYDILQDSWTSGPVGGRSRYKASSAINQDKIFYYGGRTGLNATVANTSIVSVDIFDIGTNKWYTGGSNTAPREGHQMVSYGTDIIVGGGLNRDKSLELNILESYGVNPWTTGSPSPLNFRLHSGDAKDGNLYTYGGLNSAGQISNSLLSYNTVLDQWSILDSQGDFRYGHKGAIFQNRFYNFGGKDSSNTLDSIDIFDIGSDSWISGYSGGEARINHSINIQSDGIQLIGGLNSSNVVTSSFDNYTISVSHLGWRTEVYTGLHRSNGTIAEYNNRLYLHGGQDSSKQVQGDFYIYDLSARSTISQTITTYVRAGHTVSIKDDKLYYIGGFPDENGLNKLMQYDLSQSQWQLKNDKGTSRYFHNSLIKNNVLAVFGGENKQGILPTIDRYDLSQNTWLSSRFTLFTRSKQGLGTFNNRSFLFGGESQKDFANNNFEYYDHDVIDQNNPPVIESLSVLTDNSTLHNIRVKFTLSDKDLDEMSVALFYRVNNQGDYHPIVYSHLSGQTQNLSNKTYTLTWSAIKDLSLDSSIQNIDFKLIASDGLETTDTQVLRYQVGSYIPSLFTNLPTFLEKKSSHTATLAQGVIYVYGGFNEQGVPSGSLNEYFINDNNWLVDFIPSPQSRAEHTATLLNEKIYHFGGVGVGGIRSDFSVYGIIPANEWLAGDTAAPTARHRHTAVIQGNEIWMIAGRTNSGVTNTIDVYNTLTKVWRTQVSEAVAREYHDSFVYQNKLYILGGIDSTGNFVLEPDIYDLSSQIWSKGEPAPFGLKEQSAVLWQDKIVLLGGSTNTQTPVLNQNVLIYNINEGTWTVAPYSGNSRRNADLVINSSTIDSIFILGGEIDTQLNTMERFNLGK
ncbi:MAG: hypothetical protein KC646_11460 [Candidatus Cloacimonetes bacterium]|nr:hypothetical protein [Candidatus Cloacimonadota bacterium]